MIFRVNSSAAATMCTAAAQVDLLPKGTDFNCVGDWVVEAITKKKLKSLSFLFTLAYVIQIFGISFKPNCLRAWANMGISSANQAYWQRSWDELVAFDLTASIQYVHGQTGQNLHYVGHSLNSNLRQHIKAAHLEEKPFACSIPGCDMRFSFKHVRDNHEKSGCHVYTVGDFVNADDQFQMRPRGGRKRQLPSMMDALMRKRVHPPSKSDSILNQGSDYLSWLLSSGDE